MRNKIYAFIRQFIDANKYSPTVREICKGVGLKSTASVFCHLQILRRNGRINYVDGLPRTITIGTTRLKGMCPDCGNYNDCTSEYREQSGYCDDFR